MLDFLSSKGHSVVMLLVGASLIPLGVQRYPAFLAVGVFYLSIGLRGLRAVAREAGRQAVSDKTQFESL